jgi:pyruvate,water dikinase
VVRGYPGSSGLARGPARVVRTLTEVNRVRKGDILVAETTMPAWTPLFATVAAVVTDVGGVTSHCAIVAREYGIPAVVGTTVATSVIRDGHLLEVDGQAGTVRLLESRQ